MSALPEERDVSLPELIEQLPPEMQREVRDFVEFLLAKRRRAQSGEPSFSWEGALADLREQYTSVELQHAATGWMAEAD
ncbi:MAG: DUF2281 domain-containing protein [Anaerolineae bacterium]